MTLPQIPEHERARNWRENAGLTRAALAKLTGYSYSAIQDIERGTHPNGNPVPHTAMQRYRLACAAISANLVRFDWDKPPHKSLTK